jgi:hypothetical protein
LASVKQALEVAVAGHGDDQHLGFCCKVCSGWLIG